eukprot:4667_1
MKHSVSLLGASESRNRDAATLEFEIENADNPNRTWSKKDLQHIQEAGINDQEQNAPGSIFLTRELHKELSFRQILWMSFTFFFTRVYLWSMVCALVVSCLILGLLQIPFGVKPHYDKTTDIKHMYFDYTLLVYAAQVPNYCGGILLGGAIASALSKKWRWYDIVISTGGCLLVLGFIGMTPTWFFSIHLYWYAVEANATCVMYLITLTFVIFYIIGVRGSDLFSFKQVFKYSIFSMIITATILATCFQYLNTLYYDSNIASKIIIRGILFPICNNVIIGCAEYWSYHVGDVKYKRQIKRELQINPNIIVQNPQEELVDIERRNHGLYNSQIVILLVGRVWISYIETIEDVLIICAIQSFWDLFIHRMSRPLNMMLTAWCLDSNSIKTQTALGKFLTKWRAIFNNEKLLLYRAVIINAEYVADTCVIISNAVFIIGMIATKHEQHNELVWNIPPISALHMIEFAIIQLLFNMFTHIVTGAIDIKYGRINLFEPWKRRSFNQYLSELTAFICISFVGSYYLYRQVPNYIQCSNFHDVCSCDFADAKFGC